jgi:hypothetical protein
MATKQFQLLLTVFFSLFCFTLIAQYGSYTKPPKEIADMLLAKPTPAVSIDDKGEWILFGDVNTYPPVEELARPELKIAGLRINPANFAPGRQNFATNLYLKNIPGNKEFNGFTFSIICRKYFPES